MKPEMKKLIIANLPYLLFVYLFGKLGQAYRLAEGIDLSQKLLHFADGCAAAFESAAPSFHPIDLLIGVAGAAALRLMVYCKGDPYDNAVAENFFSCLKCECVHLRHFASRAQAMADVFAYIETFYNPVRPHSSIGWRPPDAFARVLSEHPAA